MKDYKILIVDDDVVLLDLMSRRLERLGYKPDRAENGEEAIQFVQKNDYDLVVTDIYMPKSTGIDLIGVVMQKDPQTQIIAITGGAMIDLALSAIEKGAFAYLSKPFDHLKVFDHAVKKALEYRSMLLAGYQPGSDAQPTNGANTNREQNGNYDKELNQIFESIPQAIAILDPNGELVFANSAAKGLFRMGLDLKGIAPHDFRAALNGGPGASLQLRGSSYTLRASEIHKNNGDVHILFHLQSSSMTSINGSDISHKYLDVLKTCLAWFYKQRLREKEFQVLRAMAVQVSKLEEIHNGSSNIPKRVSGLTARLPAMEDLRRVLTDGPQ